MTTEIVQKLYQLGIMIYDTEGNFVGYSQVINDLIDTITIIIGNN